jgi:hypothetical protein
MEEKMTLQPSLLLPLLLAYLYRWGGGDIYPMKKGFKPARRYGIPLALFLYDPNVMNIIPMVILSLILHFNLTEIETKEWDDVFCYGFAQAWCLSWLAGPYSIWVGLVWITGVLASNKFPERFKLDWKYVELIFGFTLGLVCLL